VPVGLDPRDAATAVKLARATVSNRSRPRTNSVRRMHARRRRKGLLTTVAMVALAAVIPAGASADSCVGQPGCPYSSVASILPRPLALGPLAVSSRGDVFALSAGDYVVIHLTPAGEIPAGWDAAGRRPAGIATDPAGSTVYITESDLGNVSVFLASGAFRGPFASEGTGPGQLVNPVAIARDAANNVYVGDSVHGIQKFNSARRVVEVVDAPPGGTSLALAGPDGIVLAVAAPGLPSVVRYTTSLEPTGSFALPAGVGFPQIAVDSIGDIYVSDQAADLIYQYAASGHFLTAFGGLGTSLGSLNQPSGLGIDGSDNLYAADTGNARIQKFALVAAASTTLAPRGAAARATAARATRHARLRIHCEARGADRCAGTLRVLRAGRVVSRGRFSVPDAATRAVSARIRGRVRRQLARGRRIAVRVELRTRQPGGAGVRILRHRHFLLPAGSR
jgi:sugar lactone lactonase YvrE